MTDDYAEARRVYKLLKNGMIEQSDLGPREYGLLYLYYPWTLPDVDAGEGAA